MAPVLTCMSVNTQRGGLLDSRLQPENRLPGLCAVVRDHAPDLVGWQEVSARPEGDGHRIAEVEQATGLTAVRASFVPGQSTGLMYNPQTMHLAEWESVHGNDWGFSGTAVFDLGLAYRVSVVVAHLSHRSAAGAEGQCATINDRARRCADRAQPPGAPRAEASMVFGDLNHPKLHRADVAEPAPEQLPAANVGARFTTAQDGQLVVDRRVAELFARTRWTDAAHHLADRTQDPDKRARLLAPTGHNGGFAVDWVLLSESMAPALLDMDTIAVPSDHKALWWQIDPARIDPARVVCLHA